MENKTDLEKALEELKKTKENFNKQLEEIEKRRKSQKDLPKTWKQV